MPTSSPSQFDKLNGRNVLLIGGSSGIGFGVAAAALSQGANVVLSSSQQPKIDSAIARLQAAFPTSTSSITGHACDLSRLEELEGSLTRLLDSATAKSKLDHIVVTAGDALAIKPLSEATIEGILATGTVRFFAALILGKLAPKYLNSGPASSITLTGGVAAQRPAPNWTTIAAFSAGIQGMTRGLAVDLAPLRVNVVSPGAVHTELFDKMPQAMQDNLLQMFKNASVLNKVGTPDEVAEAYLYCMRSTFVTGQVLTIEGGMLLKR